MIKRLARWILRKELAEQDLAFKKLLEPTIEKFHFENGRIEAAFQHPWAIKLMANAFSDTLIQWPCDNYIEFHFMDIERRALILVTVHRPGGKTPYELKEKAELELAEFKAKINTATKQNSKTTE